MQRMRSLIEIASSFLSTDNSRLLISISSGARHVIHVNKAEKDMMNTWDNIMKRCRRFTTIGFTYDEAKRYFTNKDIEFDDIYPLTGTNPLLLSENLEAENLGSAEGIVNTRVDNLNISKQDDKKNYQNIL